MRVQRAVREGLQTDGFLSFRDVAELFDVTPGTVHRWRRSGARGRRLQSVLAGGKRMVARTQLSEFLQRDAADTLAGGGDGR